MHPSRQDYSSMKCYTDCYMLLLALYRIDEEIGQKHGSLLSLGKKIELFSTIIINECTQELVVHRNRAFLLFFTNVTLSRNYFGSCKIG